MIGLECEFDEVPDNIIGLVLENVDLEKYFWDLTYAEPSILFGDEYNYFQNNGLRKFIKKVEKEQIPQLVLKGYGSSEHIDAQNNQEFLNSNCEIVLIICDVAYIEVYFKKDNAKTIINNFDKMNIKYKIKTLENDGRYTYNLF